MPLNRPGELFIHMLLRQHLCCLVGQQHLLKVHAPTKVVQVGILGFYASPDLFGMWGEGGLFSAVADTGEM